MKGRGRKLYDSVDFGLFFCRAGGQLMLDGKKMKRADICDGVEVVLDARLLEFALLLRLPFQ